jgi:hypothetical protein
VAQEGISVEVLGVSELIAGTAQLADNIERGAGPAFLGVADEAAARARSSVHIDTGATAASILTRGEGKGALVSMGDGVPYASYEEYGGRGWPHTGTGNFLYPAVEATLPSLDNAAEQLAAKEIGDMSWPSP